MATERKDRIKVGLDETRMIVLVVQVLLGFGCRAAFEPGFERLPATAQTMKMVSFGLLIVSLALLLAIPAFHRIAEEGDNTSRCERVMRKLMALTLWPFAAALGIDLGLATFAVFGASLGIATAALTTVVAVSSWYALGSFSRRRSATNRRENMNDKHEPTPLEDKVKQVLTECRIVLPGTQALLGFQLIAVMTEAFAKLPRAEQVLHLGALDLIALSGILLMTPPAYHRIALSGEMTTQFLRLASNLLLAAMMPLALGISLDFYIVLSKVTKLPAISFGAAALSFLAFVGCWLIFPYLNRRRPGTRAAVHGHATAEAA